MEASEFIETKKQEQEAQEVPMPGELTAAVRRIVSALKKKTAAEEKHQHGDPSERAPFYIDIKEPYFCRKVRLLYSVQN